MNFKQALIAHLQGERVQKKIEYVHGWVPFTEDAENVTLAQVLDPSFASKCEFRIAPRTIQVNGVEVAAPESVAPCGVDYFIPCVWSNNMCIRFTWDNDKHDKQALERGLVYLNKEDAIARAKAMLLTQE